MCAVQYNLHRLYRFVSVYASRVMPRPVVNCRCTWWWNLTRCFCSRIFREIGRSEEIEIVEGNTLGKYFFRGKGGRGGFVSLHFKRVGMVAGNGERLDGKESWREEIFLFFFSLFFKIFVLKESLNRWWDKIIFLHLEFWI